MGKTKRVILGDTLLGQFSNSEIETVLAHELGHFKHKDIWKQFGIGVLVSFFAFWLAFWMLKINSSSFGLRGAGDIGDFPLLCLVFYLFSLLSSPASNAYSRYVERKADEFALRIIPDRGVFISAMEKLSAINLSDPNPHPVIEFLLYDHPSIQKRIQFAQEFSL